jgi:hypothetical protein
MEKSKPKAPACAQAANPLARAASPNTAVATGTKPKTPSSQASKPPLGLSIQGISQAQLTTLKTRMEATKQKLEQAQAAPEAQRATILQGLTGDHLTGDLLTATLWGYYAAIQSHGAIASSQAQMFDRPALSYGLFHAQVGPTSSTASSPQASPSKA